MPSVSTAPQKRHSITINVKPEAKDAVDQMCERYAMKQQDLLSRTYEWLASQDEGVQVMVLGLLPKSHEADVVDAIATNIKAKAAKGFRRPRKG